jgi:hypothetical protein
MIDRDKVLGIVRHSLTFVGGILIMKGYGDEAIWQEITGASITLIGGIWSVISKTKKR